MINEQFDSLMKKLDTIDLSIRLWGAFQFVILVAVLIVLAIKL